MHGGAIVVKYIYSRYLRKLKNPLRKNMDQDDKNDKGIDLSGSLKDSGAGVKFKEYRAPSFYYSETPKIIQWVMKYSGGLVKNEKRASYVLIGFAAVAIIIALILVFGRAGRNLTQVPTKIPESPEESPY